MRELTGIVALTQLCANVDEEEHLKGNSQSTSAEYKEGDEQALALVVD